MAGRLEKAEREYRGRRGDTLQVEKSYRNLELDPDWQIDRTKLRKIIVAVCASLEHPGAVKQELDRMVNLRKGRLTPAR